MASSPDPSRPFEALQAIFSTWRKPELEPHLGLGTMTEQPTEGLTPEQLAFFNENGYLLIPDALSQDTVKELLADTDKMLNEFSLDDHPMTKFSTGGDDGADHVGDQYFLESGDKVRFFFEEGTYICSTTGYESA
jgi:phytanoyl-CoA hydroxylase